MSSIYDSSQNGDRSYSSLGSRLEAFKRSDVEREELMQQLLNETSSLQSKLQTVQDDLHNEQVSRRHWQSRSDGLEQHLNRLQSTLNSDPFALALIDGDGCIFQDHLLAAAADGGADAAHTLYTAIRNMLQERNSSFASASSMIVQIYCNMEDLSRKLTAVGILQTSADMYAFARAFSATQPLFSIIDVGRGKERADHKIKEMFRLFVRNSHCKHIIFGGCHDNGYLVNLEPYNRDEDVASRLTLLETTKAEWQYEKLRFPLVSFQSVFRSDPLPANRITLPQRSLPFPAGASAGLASGYPPGLGPPTNALPPRIDSPVQSPNTGVTPPAQAPGSVLPTRQKPQAEPDNIKSPSPGLTYANISNNNDAGTNISIAPTKAPPPKKYMLLNKDGERVDEPLPKADPVADMRLRKRMNNSGRLCNNWHLKKGCYNRDNCKYDHEPRLAPAELNCLRRLARTAPCSYGSHCTTLDCFSGHHCIPERCRGKDCFFAKLHGVDEKPTIKLFEDDTTESLHS